MYFFWKESFQFFAIPVVGPLSFSLLSLYLSSFFKYLSALVIINTESYTTFHIFCFYVKFKSLSNKPLACTSTVLILPFCLLYFWADKLYFYAVAALFKITPCTVCTEYKFWITIRRQLAFICVVTPFCTYTSALYSKRE